jgi:lipid-A-disaccharide synthase-like uncharacterized protein
MKRFKWEPPALMILVLALGAWLVWNNKNQFTGIKPAEGARTVEFRLGNARGVVEVTESAAQPESPGFRVLLRNGFASPSMNSAEFEKQFGPQALHDVVHQGDNLFFRLFNITGWSSLAWVVVGLGGQCAFSGRMFLQWVVSEKERKSVVPPAFWYLSLGGGVALFAYFVWRQDFVGVLGQSSGLVIYARNIRLIHKQRLREAEGATSV